MSLDNKIEVRNRMIKKAANLWGVSPNEIESSFDPLVSLLIDACASEIGKISGEVNNSHTRITERLIQLMTPETSYGAQPAHAIAYAIPNSSQTTIAPENLLYLKKKIKNQNGGQEVKTIYFSPVHDSKLVNAQISRILCDDKEYHIGEKGKTVSENKLSLKNKSYAFPSTLYIGISANEPKINLKGVSLFFELMDIGDKELFYNELQQAEVYYNNQLLDVSVGYNNSSDSERQHIESIFSAKPNKTRNVEYQVKKTYEKHYLTITSDVLLPKKSEIPEEFTKFINLDDHADFNDFRWIKVVFPRIIGNSTLKKVYCSLNTFPVLNRKLESISYQLKDYVDVVPFSTMDLFLDVKKVNNIAGKPYKLRENDEGLDQKGTYVIRRDNIGKLDSRRAKEYLMHLIELLKDESAAFSLFGNSFIQSNIDQLNQSISLLENKIADTSNKTEETNYLSVKPYRKRETILLEYWSTNGDEANNIKSSSALQVYKGSELQQAECFLVTPTFQGKNSLTMEERLYAYRRALLSRNRIVTKEDIKALCYELCGKKIVKVTVGKGFKASNGKQKGIIPVIEINLFKNNGSSMPEIEWLSLKNNILSILEQQSLNTFPYDINLIN